MKVILRAYKFELKPTKEQKVLLDKHFGCVRFVFNHFLNERINFYEENKETDLKYKPKSKYLTELKNQEETSWLYEVSNESLQKSLKNLDTAYVNFFKQRVKFPKFKSKKGKNSFSLTSCKITDDSKLHIIKFKEGIKVIQHRPINGTIKNCTISKTPTRKYFVSILVEEQYEPKQKTGLNIGCDLGLKTFVALSNGTKLNNNKYTKKYEGKLRKAQKHFSRKKHGSHLFEKQKLKVAKIHEKITNSRMDNLHKVSNQLVTDYDIICLESLNIKGMVKNHRLAKHISDASWGTFVSFVEYKAKWNDKQVVKIDTWFPSSKTCSGCGFINHDLKLSTREWICPECHTHLDRDNNAANNILVEGLKILSVGIIDYTNGAKIRPRNTKAQALKLEA